MHNAGVERGNIVTIYPAVAKAVNLFRNTAKFFQDSAEEDLRERRGIILYWDLHARWILI